MNRAPSGDVAYLKRLFDHDGWANRETLASLSLTDAPSERAMKVMAHILGAERLWLARLQESKEPSPVWPELSLKDCSSEIAELEIAWEDYLDELSAADLDREVAYVNSKGERWTSRAGDILMHVVLHSTYHRGQIASDLRAAGEEPATTDFIHALRQGLVE